MNGPYYKLKVGYNLPEDEKSILELERIAWGTGEPGISPYFQWQYLQNPFGPTLTASMTSATSGSLVAHIASISVPVQVNRQWFHGGIVVNAVTHPEHRNRGLFERVGKALVCEARRIGQSLLICVPNKFSSSVFRNKLEFHEVANHRLIVKWIDPGILLRQHGFRLVGEAISAVTRTFVSGERKQPRNFSLSAIRPVEDIRAVSLDRLLSRPPHQMTPRGREWLHWRYGTHPTRRYRFIMAGSTNNPCALMVYHVMTPYEKAFLSDFFYTPEASSETIKGLANFLKNSVREQGASAIWSIARKGSRREQLLKKSGFVVMRLGSLSAPTLLARSVDPEFHELALSDMQLSFGSLINCD